MLCTVSNSSSLYNTAIATVLLLSYHTPYHSSSPPYSHYGSLARVFQKQKHKLFLVAGGMSGRVGMLGNYVSHIDPP